MSPYYELSESEEVNKCYFSQISLAFNLWEIIFSIQVFKRVLAREREAFIRMWETETPLMSQKFQDHGQDK